MRFIIITAIISVSTGVLSAQPNYPTNPLEAQLIYSDVENFITAFSKLDSSVDTIRILQEYYFSKASPGLTEYINRHSLTPEILRDAIKNNPTDYEHIRLFIAGIKSFENRYRETLFKYKATLPTAMFPPTYLLVGANRGIAQASAVGQLVTITRIVSREDRMLHFIVHELTHFQQVLALGYEKYSALYRQENNMLGLILREGGAELITQLITGEITQSAALEYLSEHEARLRKKFKTDLVQQNKSYWLWDTVNNKEIPPLLGYAIGYQICKSHYDKVQNKNRALVEILGMENPEEFLSVSGYFSINN